MNCKEQWEGIHTASKDYQPKIYANKDKLGNIVTLDQRAEATREYLEDIHWGDRTNWAGNQVDGLPPAVWVPSESLVHLDTEGTPIEDYLTTIPYDSSTEIPVSCVNIGDKVGIIEDKSVVEKARETGDWSRYSRRYYRMSQE